MIYHDTGNTTFENRTGLQLTYSLNKNSITVEWENGCIMQGLNILYLIYLLTNFGNGWMEGFYAVYFRTRVIANNRSSLERDNDVMCNFGIR